MQPVSDETLTRSVLHRTPCSVADGSMRFEAQHTAVHHGGNTSLFRVFLALCSPGWCCTRLRLTASPATGLVGMQENAFLGDFFDCIGFLPLANQRCCVSCSCCVHDGTKIPPFQIRTGIILKSITTDDQLLVTWGWKTRPACRSAVPGVVVLSASSAKRW